MGWKVQEQREKGSSELCKIQMMTKVIYTVIPLSLWISGVCVCMDQSEGGREQLRSHQWVCDAYFAPTDFVAEWRTADDCLRCLWSDLKRLKIIPSIYTIQIFTCLLWGEPPLALHYPASLVLWIYFCSSGVVYIDQMNIAPQTTAAA